MPLDQPIFSEVIDADERNRAAQDELRSNVQEWFDRLPARQKDAFGAWIDSTAQCDALVTLCAAAGDWNRTRMQELFKCLS